MKDPYKKQIFHTLITLSIPTILEQLLSTLLQYVDTAMVGQLGEQATASISVTGTVNWLFNSLGMALATATVALVAKEVGAKEFDKLRSFCVILNRIVLFMGIGLSILAIGLAPHIPVWMGAEPAIHKDASTYFIIISIPFIFRLASAVYGAAIRGTQDTKTPMLINFCSNILNAILNYVFIYGMDLGVTGAAIGSAISYTIGGILMFRSYQRNQILSQGTLHTHYNNTLFKELMVLSIPVLGTNLVSCLGYVMFAGMVSGMGTTIFAAHSIAVTAETIFYIPGYGLRSATSALVGLSYGEKDVEKFRTVSQISIFLTLGMMFINGILLYLCAYPLMRVFTNSPEVALIGARVLRIVAFTEPFFGLMAVLEGIFYGLGRTKYVFYIESFSMWCIRVFFTFLCVKIWHFGLDHVWYCMITDNICKATLLSIPFFRLMKIKSFHQDDAR